MVWNQIIEEMAWDISQIDSSRIQYSLRPGYGKEKPLLLEFSFHGSSKSFLAQLLPILKQIDFHCNDIQDLWMNDQIEITFQSPNGTIDLSIDVWNLAFIHSENQELLKRIDTHLLAQPVFQSMKWSHEKITIPMDLLCSLCKKTMPVVEGQTKKSSAYCDKCLGK
ncbi:MAG: hypothetical protein RL095_2332 [Verrucomicrobiota bacterium]|jgi:hypothetical protein